MIKANIKTNPVIASNLEVLAIFTLPFEHILCIHHLVQFKKDQVKVQALLNFDIKINTMISAYMANTSMAVILDMLFLTFSNTNVFFVK